MSDIWNETWTSDGERVELCQNEPPYDSVVVACIGTFHHRDNECLEVERAKLAAAAPDMARALLAMVVSRNPDGRCLECVATAKHSPICPVGHAEDALRKAGVWE